MNRLVSVVMPAFNCGKYIQEAILSILAQTYSNFELIIWDDGSTDDTVHQIEAINDDRIVLYKNLKNQGYPSVMNSLFEKATGEFVMIQDGDDRSHPNRINSLLSVLDQNPEIDLAGSHLTRFYENGKTDSELSELSANKLNYDFKIYARPGLTFGTLFMRQSVTKIRFRNLMFITRAQDIDWLFRVSEFHHFKNSDSFLYEYRQHDKSMSNAYDKESIYNYFFWEYIFFVMQFRREKGIDLLKPKHEKQLAHFLNESIKTKKKADSVFWERHLAYRAKRNGFKLLAIKYALRAVRNHPFNRGSYQCVYKVLFQD